MAEELGLPFDPIDRASDLWSERIGDPRSMRLATSVIRVQQLLIARLDAALRPMGITFARYEVLVLLSFSRAGSLPLSKIGQRLMVHPTSVTNLVDRLERQGLVQREADDTDRRRTFARLTAEGKDVLQRATEALDAIDFGIVGLDSSERDIVYGLLRTMRAASGDFPGPAGATH